MNMRESFSFNTNDLASVIPGNPIVDGHTSSLHEYVGTLR
jgi:hypothetical protein